MAINYIIGLNNIIRFCNFPPLKHQSMIINLVSKFKIFTLSTFLLVQIGFSQTTEQLDSLDAYYAKAMQEWNIPGMAIAIVSGDEIVFAKGYGYANLENKAKVDANTLFAIASNSKAFTSTALAQLVDQGKISWKDKVTDYLPYFATYSPYVTENFTIADLLSHRSGLKTFSGDLLWYGTDLSPEEIITSSQHLEPIYGFREHFGYSNINYIAAGMVIEAVTDTGWAEYVSQHFLKPLGMERTLTSTSQIASTSNVATPYFYEDGVNIELEWVNWDNIAPAGAIISSVNDYAKWIMLVNSRGNLNGKLFISDGQFEEMTTPHINHKLSSSSRGNSPSKHFSAYGLGFTLNDYHGFKILSHGGGYDGMISKSCFVPEKKLGFIILTNNLNWLTGALMNKTLDVILDDNTEGEDWSALYLGIKKSRDKEKAVKLVQSDSLRGKIGSLSHELKDYTGTYSDKMYGDVVVWEEEGRLSFKMVRTQIFEAQLEHWNLETFTFRFNTNLSSLPEGKLWFKLDKNGKITGLKIDIPNPDFFFTEFDFIKQNEE